MDPYAHARQNFERVHGRPPTEVEVADTMLALAAFLYLGTLNQQQVCQRILATMTPGTPSHAFMISLLT